MHIFLKVKIIYWASLLVHRLRICLPMQGTHVQSLGQEDPLGKEMATPSSVVAWRTPWTKEPGGLQSMGLQRVGHSRAAYNFAFAQEHTVAQIHCSASSNISVR